MGTSADHLGVAVLPSERDWRRLLQSVVDVARAIFDAQASSIFLLDETRRYLVFHAVSGAGAPGLLGERIPASKGIAGWVLGSRQPVAVGDVAAEARFARDFAESTGYVPCTILAAPLVYDDRAVGVLEVLDHAAERTRMLGDLDLLALFAGQATVAVELLGRMRAAAGAMAPAADPEHTALRGITEALGTLGGHRRALAVQLLTTAHELIAEPAEESAVRG